MLLELLDTKRDIGRLSEMAAVLARHGFGDMVQRLGMETVLAKAGRVFSRDAGETPQHLAPPARIRRAMEDLGPTFVKLGQILSTRVDLFPPAYIAEFEKLRDRVPTLPYDDLVAEVEAQVGCPLTDLFAEIDREPLAAGSIAQVHAARLKTGEAVVLKIRRPGIEAVVNADLRLLMRLADIAEREIAEIRRFRPRAVIAEFARSIRMEMDLANECRNADRLAEAFRDWPGIAVPKIHWAWTSAVMNVQERIEGIAGSDLAGVDAAGLDRRALARTGADAVLKMVFEDRFFHADPHPGNVIYRSDGQIVFLDFGMVGQLSRTRRDELVALLAGVVDRRAERVVEILIDWADTRNAGLDVAGLSARIDAFIDAVHGMPLKSLDFTAMTLDLLAILRGYDLALPPDLAMLIKAFVSLEGMGRQLDPDFDMMAAAAPVIERLMRQKYSPRELGRRARGGLADGFDLMTALPGDLRKLLALAQKGRLKLGIDVERIDDILDRFDRAVTRLTIGIVIAALTVGSSIVLTATGNEIPIALSVFAMLGFFGAVAGGIWLLYSIWRRR